MTTLSRGIDSRNRDTVITNNHNTATTCATKVTSTGASRARTTAPIRAEVIEPIFFEARLPPPFVKKTGAGDSAVLIALDVTGSDVQIPDGPADGNDSAFRIVAAVAAGDVRLVEIDVIEKQANAAIVIKLAVAGNKGVRGRSLQP